MSRKNKKIQVSFRVDKDVADILDEWKEGTAAETLTEALQAIVRTVKHLVDECNK